MSCSNCKYKIVKIIHEVYFFYCIKKGLTIELFESCEEFSEKEKLIEVKI